MQRVAQQAGQAAQAPRIHRAIRPGESRSIGDLILDALTALIVAAIAFIILPVGYAAFVTFTAEPGAFSRRGFFQTELVLAFTGLMVYLLFLILLWLFAWGRERQPAAQPPQQRQQTQQYAPGQQPSYSPDGRQGYEQGDGQGIQPSRGNVPTDDELMAIPYSPAQPEPPDEPLREPQPAAASMPLLQTFTPPDDEPLKWTDPQPVEEEHPNKRADWVSLGGAWTLAAVSVRGISHRNGKYRDDDYAIKLFHQPAPTPAKLARRGITGFFSGSAPSAQTQGAPYAALIAIADGLGSKAFSRRGARAATTGATQVDEALIHAIAQALQQPLPWSQLVEQVTLLGKKALAAAFDAAAQAVSARAKGDELAVEQLHSTLLLILALPHPHDPEQMVLITSQVGDGTVYTLSAASGAPPAFSSAPDPANAANATDAVSATASEWDWLLTPQVEEVGTQVTPFMARYQKEPDKLVAAMETREEPLTCLLAMTDGAADLLIPYDRQTPGGDFAYVAPFYADVRDVLLDAARQQQEANRAQIFKQRMVEIFNTKLGSDDDITLVCLFHNGRLASTTDISRQATGVTRGGALA